MGKNNAGKTSLLEAIYLLKSSAGDPFVAVSRGEDLPGARTDLFNRTLATKDTNAFVIASDRERHEVVATLSDSMILWARGEHTESYQLGVAPNLPAERPFLIDLGSKPGFDILKAWGDIEFTPKEDDVLSCMKLIAPDIERVGLRTKVHKPVVRLQKQQAAVSMASLGGGVIRMFYLACGLILSDNDVCLVEEIDSGIHHSLHAEIWKFVFKVARRYSVQVFATTHGLDCLRGFAEASHDLSDIRARVIRLEERKGHVSPVVFDERQFQIAAEEAIEIR